MEHGRKLYPYAGGQRVVVRFGARGTQLAEVVEDGLSRDFVRVRKWSARAGRWTKTVIRVDRAEVLGLALERGPDS